MKNIESTSSSLPVPEHQSPQKSTLPSSISSMVESTSMNLIDDSANHLLGLMKGLHANAPPAEIKTYDPDKVRAACMCASEIHKLMRLKYDVVKLGLGVKG